MLKIFTIRLISHFDCRRDFLISRLYRYTMVNKYMMMLRHLPRARLLATTPPGQLVLAF